MSTTFSIPNVPMNRTSWGPVSTSNNEEESTFDLTSSMTLLRNEKMGKFADFVNSKQSYSYTKRHNEEYNSRSLEEKEEDSFQLIDTAKAPRPRLTNTRIRSTNPLRDSRLRAAQAARVRQGTGGVTAASINKSQTNRGKTQRDHHHSQRGGRYHGHGHGHRGGSHQQQEMNKNKQRKPSVMTSKDWEVLEEYDLIRLNKLKAAIPKGYDLRLCGQLCEYDELYDRITSKKEKILQRYENREFYYVRTLEDPVIEEIATLSSTAGNEKIKPVKNEKEKFKKDEDEISDDEEEETSEESENDEIEYQQLNVFITDSLMSHLMACSRSVFSWDIVVHKMNGKLFFDRRDASTIEYLTVNETSLDTNYIDENPESPNGYERLSIEATMINQNFTQQIMKDDDKMKGFEYPNPFAYNDDSTNDSTPAAFLYRYRYWNLGDNICVVSRCELHGLASKKSNDNKDHYMTAYALNEWNVGMKWKQKIDTQRAVILSTELKNNSFKLAKWTAQAILADAEVMKLGYISRQNIMNPSAHTVLCVNTYKPTEFAQQIALNVQNMWGILKMFCQYFMEQEDGKYLIFKEPLKQSLKIFKIPENTFEDEEGDDN